MQKTWESYHLIRDTLRGDTAEVLQWMVKRWITNCSTS
ncbi:hypothetical protein CQA77_30255 [Klebsiella pneumoniae]|nr:hypothetical protein CQA77_30255 [Klebsiella pneumoniae]